MTGGALFLQLSLDGNYLFVHDASPNTIASPGAGAWTVFDLTNGKLVSHPAYDSMDNSVSVIDQTVLYVEEGTQSSTAAGLVTPKNLKARGFVSDSPLWTYALPSRLWCRCCLRAAIAPSPGAMTKATTPGAWSPRITPQLRRQDRKLLGQRLARHRPPCFNNNAQCTTERIRATYRPT